MQVEDWRDDWLERRFQSRASNQRRFIVKTFSLYLLRVDVINVNINVEMVCTGKSREKVSKMLKSYFYVKTFFPTSERLAYHFADQESARRWFRDWWLLPASKLQPGCFHWCLLSSLSSLTSWSRPFQPCSHLRIMSLFKCTGDRMLILRMFDKALTDDYCGIISADRQDFPEWRQVTTQCARVWVPSSNILSRHLDVPVLVQAHLTCLACRYHHLLPLVTVTSSSMEFNNFF